MPFLANILVNEICNVYTYQNGFDYAFFLDADSMNEVNKKDFEGQNY